MPSAGANAAISGVIVLASVVAAIGAHSVLGSPVAEGPDPDTVDNTAFCAAMDNVAVALPASDAAYSALGSAAASDDLIGLHAAGATASEAGDAAAATLRAASREIEHPQVEAALKALADAQKLVVVAAGDAATSADSVEDYAATFASHSSDPERVAAVERVDDSVDAINAYARRACGFTISVASATSIGEHDAELLGSALEVFFASWDSADPLPEVNILGLNYVIDGTIVGPVSDGVELTDQRIDGAEDWCVEVIESATGTPYSYSSALGLAQSACSDIPSDGLEPSANPSS